MTGAMPMEEMTEPTWWNGETAISQSEESCISCIGDALRTAGDLFHLISNAVLLICRRDRGRDYDCHEK
jgi:hypothetical protein